MKRMIRQRKLNLGLFGFLTLAGVMVIACLMVSGGKVVEAGGGGGDVDYDHAPKLPLYRLVRHKMSGGINSFGVVDSLLTTSDEEAGEVKGNGFEVFTDVPYLDKKKGIVAYILKDPLPGTVPLVRFHANGDSNDHFMTIDQKEAERIVREGSYEFDKILGYVGENPLPNTVPLKRFFYPPDIFDKYGHHDYCLCDGTEKSYGQQIEKYHEKDEGYVWTEPISKSKGTNSPAKGKGSPNFRGLVMTAPPQSYDLLCRGDDNVAKRFGLEPGANAKLLLHFEKGTAPGRRESLLPGQCSWVDRGMRENEPNTIVHNVTNGESEREPPYQWYAVLRGSNGYWLFSVYNDDGLLRVTGSRPDK